MVIPKKKWVGLKKEEPNVFDAFRDGVLITDLDSEIAVTFRCCCGKHFQQEPGYEIPRTTLTRSVRDKQMKHTTKFYAKVSLKSFCSFNFSGLYFRGHRLEPMRLGGVKRRQTITIPHSPPPFVSTFSSSSTWTSTFSPFALRWSLCQMLSQDK